MPPLHHARTCTEKEKKEANLCVKMEQKIHCDNVNLLCTYTVECRGNLRREWLAEVHKRSREVTLLQGNSNKPPSTILKLRDAAVYKSKQGVCVSCGAETKCCIKAPPRSFYLQVFMPVLRVVCVVCVGRLCFVHFRLIFLMLTDVHRANQRLQHSSQSPKLRNEWEPCANTRMHLSSTISDVWATSPLFQKSGPFFFFNGVTIPWLI